MKKILCIVIPTVAVTCVLLLTPILSGLFTTDVEYIYPTITDVYNYSVCSGVITENEGNLMISASISEHDIPRVRVGQKVKISGSALGDKIYDGKISSIATKATKQGSSSSKTVLKCSISFDESPKDLKAGYNVTAKIVTSITSSAIVVPFDNCIKENGNYYVYILNGNCASRQLVEITDETPTGFVISSGVTSESMLICFPEKLSGNDVRVNAKAFGEGY